jgi:2-phospho-L-lactate guanylyltransferase (CobY/MobA/RfbA family)
LNEALRLADSQIPQGDEMLVLPADLPTLEIDDVHALLDSQSECAIAPNRARDGTNALLYRRGPRLFRFGQGSFAAHLREHRQGGGAWEIVERPGLAFDLDLPSDYCELLTKTDYWKRRAYLPMPMASMRAAPA